MKCSVVFLTLQVYFSMKSKAGVWIEWLKKKNKDKCSCFLFAGLSGCCFHSLTACQVESSSAKILSSLSNLSGERSGDVSRSLTSDLSAEMHVRIFFLMCFLRDSHMSESRGVGGESAPIARFPPGGKSSCWRWSCCRSGCWTVRSARRQTCCSTLHGWNASPRHALTSPCPARRGWGDTGWGP